MKITNIRTFKKKVVVYCKNKKIEISPSTFSELHLYNNKELTIEEIKQIKLLNSFNHDLDYALSLINKHPYTQNKLINKLKQKNVKIENINKIISYLSKHKLLDDFSFAKEYANSLMLKHKGKKIIKDKLLSYGIDSLTIHNVIIGLNEEEMMSILKKYIETLLKRYTNNQTGDLKNKIINACLASGHDISMIYKVLDTIKLPNIKYDEILKRDYLKYKRVYDSPQKIISALRRKGYSYSKIKLVMEEDYDLS